MWRSMGTTSTSASGWPSKPCTPCIDGYGRFGGSSCDDEVNVPDEPVLGPTSTLKPGSNSLVRELRRRGSDSHAQATDVLWGAGCVSCACPVLTGGWRGDSPSLPDPISQFNVDENGNIQSQIWEWK